MDAHSILPDIVERLPSSALIRTSEQGCYCSVPLRSSQRRRTRLGAEIQLDRRAAMKASPTQAIPKGGI
jgi:hypothetical protein